MSQESEQELRLLVETIPALVWRAGPEGNIEYVNKRVLEYLGAPLSEVIGWGWMDKVHPDDVAFKVRTWLQNLKSGNPHDVVCRFRGADGRYRWFEVRGEPLRASDGTVLSWYGVLIDIDDRIKAEEAFRESEYKLRQIIDTVPGFLWSTGSDGSEGKKAEEQPGSVAQLQANLNVLPAYTWYAAPRGALTFVNKRTADYLGVAKDHPLRFGIDVGAEWDHSFPLLHPDDREDARKYWSSRLSTGEGGEHSYRVRSAQGDYRWFLTRMEPLRASDGTLLLWLGATLDIEELKRAQEEHERLRQLESDLAHMNRVSMMGELAASLAHEITQPIAAARNNARAALNFLDKQPPDLGEVREALGCVVGDADRAGVIIDRMRDHIKKAPPRKHRFDLNEAINEVIVLARSAIAENGVSVQTRLTEGLAPVEGDRVQLQQVILNLVLNAAEAMSAVDEGARELLISTEQSRSKWRPCRGARFRAGH